MRDEEIRRLIQAERRRHHGVVAGLLGCTFAVLGIFTIGTLFVPLAVICSIVGFARAAGVLSVSGIAVSLLGCFLSVVGVASSPTLLLATAGLFAAGQHSAIASLSQPIATSSESTSSPLTRSFSIDANSESLPRSGPRAWCARANTVANIMGALNSLDTVKDSHVTVTDFQEPTTVAINPKGGSFSCHGVARITGGQLFPGTISVVADLSGTPTWQWTGDGDANTIQPLISCGSGGCFPMNDSPAAREAANRANDENRRASLANTGQFKPERGGSTK